MQKHQEVCEGVGRRTLPTCDKVYVTRGPRSDKKQSGSRCGQKSTQAQCQGPSQLCDESVRLGKSQDLLQEKVNKIMEQK